MRSTTMSQPSPGVKLARLALLSGAAVILAVLGSCTDAPNQNSITAPLKPSYTDEIGTGYDHAGRITVCVDSASPPGVYKFTNSGFRSDTAFDGHYDGANGGDGTDIENVPDGQEYPVAVGACQIVLDRITADSQHELLNQPDPMSGINLKATTIPAYATYSHTDCRMDRLQHDLATYLVYPSPCDSASNPTRAYANIHHGVVVTFTFDPVPPPSECVLGYPDNSNVPLSRTVFNESEVLRAYGRSPGEVRLWYNDEHALFLGIRRVSVNMPKGQTDFFVDHAVATMVGNPASQIGSPGSSQPQYVLTGTEFLTGAAAATDPFGRPVFPSIFVTDITTDPTSRAGDWQQGGLPRRPNELYGTWKAGVLNVDMTKTPAGRSFSLDADPAKNHWNLGAGSTPVPAGVPDQGYGSEVVWTIAGLGLNPSHNYRLQFMVHDGDMNKSGGDVGQACMNIGPSSLDRVVVNN